MNKYLKAVLEHNVRLVIWAAMLLLLWPCSWLLFEATFTWAMFPTLIYIGLMYWGLYLYQEPLKD